MSETVTVAKAEYDRLCALEEDLADTQGALAVEARLAKGEEELIPAKVVDRLVDGEPPLRVWREFRNLSQSELARATGVNRVQIVDIEADRNTGSVRTLRKLADALDVAVDDLIPVPERAPARRFNDVIEATDPRQDQEAALEAALHLLEKGDEADVNVVEPLLMKACRSPTSAMRHVIAKALLIRRKMYTVRMIDASLAAIQYADNRVPETIEVIDAILYQWDVDGDRRRVLGVLASLLSHGKHSIDLDALSHFRDRLSKESGALLGWYAVSLLLTGNPRLCLAADRLLPSDEAPGGLDIDLSAFSIDAQSVLFLARKILGYCLGSKPGASALILSCLRALPEEKRLELEEVVVRLFLINYPTAIELLEGGLKPNDPARASVGRLSRSIRAYLADLEEPGVCVTLRPSERERGLQHSRQTDWWTDAMETAKRQSVLYKLVPTSTLLYGTGTIYYMHRGDGTAPIRQEVPLATFEHAMEIPRLEVLDCVGLHNAMTHFRAEASPA